MRRKLELQCQLHQSRRHTSMFTMFRSSNDRVLLTMYPAEQKVTQRPRLTVKNNLNL